MLNVQTKRDKKFKETIAAQITKLKNRINQLYDDKLDGVISDEVYYQKKQKWEIELEEKTIEFAALSKTNQELIDRFEIMFELLENLWERYNSLESEKKRFLLNLLCSNFFYDGSKLTITIKEPFKALYKFAILQNGASNGIKLEPIFLTLAQLSLHDFELISNIKICLTT